MTGWQLPPEIWMRIFFTFCKMDVHEFTTIGPIYALARTCRHLWTIGEPYLYFDVNYHYGEDDYHPDRPTSWYNRRFLWLERSPRLWPCVRKLQIQARSWKRPLAPSAATLELFRYVRLLFLRNVKFTVEAAEGLVAAQNLEELTIMGAGNQEWGAECPEDWPLGAFGPKLKTLKFYDGPCSEDESHKYLGFFTPRSLETIEISSDPEVLRTVAQSLSNGYLDFSNLKTLGLIDSSIDHNTMITIFSACNKLRNICISSWVTEEGTKIPLTVVPSLEYVHGPLDRDMWDILRELPSLRALKLSGKYGLAELFPDGLVMPHVTHLLLPEQQGSPEILFRIGKVFPNVESLMVWRNNASSSSVDTLKELEPSLALLPRLRIFYNQFSYPDEKARTRPEFSDESKDIVALLRAKYCPHLAFLKLHFGWIWLCDQGDQSWYCAEDETEWKFRYETLPGGYLDP